MNTSLSKFQISLKNAKGYNQNSQATFVKEMNTDDDTNTSDEVKFPVVKM